MKNQKAYSFSVLLPYSNEASAMRKSIASLSKQLHKNFSVVCVVPEIMEPFLKADNVFEEVNFAYTLKIIPYGDLNISRAEGIGEVDSEWTCFINPGDEWLPLHLEVFAEAIQNNPEATAFYAQNISAGYASIGRLRKADNRIRLNRVKPELMPVVTQCCVLTKALQKIEIPWLKFPVLGDLFFLRLMDVTNEFVRINQLSCRCKNEIKNFSMVHVDVFILMTDYLIRNKFKEQPQRRWLLVSTYGWAIRKLTKNFLLLSATAYFWYFLKQYYILTRRIKYS